MLLLRVLRSKFHNPGVLNLEKKHKNSESD